MFKLEVQEINKFHANALKTKDYASYIIHSFILSLLASNGSNFNNLIQVSILIINCNSVR